MVPIIGFLIHLSPIQTGNTASFVYEHKNSSIINHMMQVWHAIGRDGTSLRKLYVETILPPFVAILRRWRPLLVGIHEFTSLDYENPLTVDNPALAADSLPLEVTCFWDYNLNFHNFYHSILSGAAMIYDFV